ncbi:SDR family oxidoreductase [Paenibacillus sp. FSL K6-0276]|uniref:SDR family oxidoreductase n=1 Tax=Paenibacillus sp. FSL K6-0276 TaxID=2921450 RepID=UPI0030ED9174
MVTGAVSGIGKASAIRFAQHGAKVYMLDRTPEESYETKLEIESIGGSATVIKCDVSNPDLVEESIRKVGDEVQKIDIIFANAGINGTWSPIETLDIEEHRRFCVLIFQGWVSRFYKNGCTRTSAIRHPCECGLSWIDRH